MRIYKPYTDEEYADLAVYCNENDCYIVEFNDYLESKENEHPKPTDEEIKELREQAYENGVDPITAHIQRLRDKDQTEEIIKEINDLLQERDAKVEEIKKRFPYTEE